MVTVHPASPEDFLDYDKLMNYLYRPLVGIVKKNHIFSCMDDGVQMRLWESNLEEHNELVFNLWKRTTSKLLRAEIAEISNSVYQRWIESVQGGGDVYKTPSKHSSPVSVG